jgi:hypothetical protein
LKKVLPTPLLFVVRDKPDGASVIVTETAFEYEKEDTPLKLAVTFLRKNVVVAIELEKT